MRRRAGPPRHDPRPRAAAAEGCARSRLRGAEPLGHGRARAVGAQAEARRGGALRQGREAAHQARHTLSSLPTGQGSEGLHVGPGAASTEARRPDAREPARVKPEEDAFGQLLLRLLEGDEPKEIVERDDGFIEAGLTWPYLAP